MKAIGVTHPLANFVLFQACWFAGILGAAMGWPEAGPLATAVWLALHFAGMDAGRAAETWLLLAAATFGYAADSALVLLGILEFPAAAQLGGPSPLWMIGLWVGFAATLRHALRWLRGRYLLGAALGAIGGPLAYRAGEALGAVTIPDPVVGLGAVAVEWLVAMPLLLAVASRSAPSAATRDTGAACRSAESRP